MELRPDVVSGLRSLFKAGATYSGFLRYILNQHSGDELHAEIIRSYIMEAFSISFFLPVRRNVDSQQNDNCYAEIDTWMIPEILSTSGAELAVDDTDESVPWWESLDLQTPDQFPTGKPAWLSSSSWEALSPTEREKVATATTSCSVLSQNLLVMARLAEQLQRRIDELDSQKSLLPHRA